jgi:hypothetical protein
MTTYTLAEEQRTSDMLKAAEVAEREAKAAAAEERELKRQRSLALAPGKSSLFTRYIVISDDDFSRITDFAFTQKNIPTGYLAGAVLEAGTDAPIPGADVYISGGPRWSGNVSAPAYLKTRTRADGTFACRVPAGKYVLSCGKMGRIGVTQQSIITVTAGSRPQITALAMSPESYLRIAVSEAETPTSSPLPCRLTFVEKQGTARPDWGDAPHGERGVRNQYFLPYGAENILLTPGRYQLYVSRGVEYDALQVDLELAPGANQVLKLALPHSLKGQMPNSFSLDAGLMTTASASGAAPPEDRVVQAVCEGVNVIVSGDFNKATDLQPTIDRLGLGKWIKAMMGMRLLLHKGTESAEILAYPLTKDQAAKLTAFLPNVHDVPPDVALSDLRKAFPNVLLEVTKPSDPERGYIAHLRFDENRHTFVDENVPPPDYDSIQIYEGKKLGLERINYPRYSELQIHRSHDMTSKVPPLSPTAFSNSSLPFSQEIGYPRMYLHTDKSDFHQLNEQDVLGRIRGQKYMVTNGPILSLSAQELPSGEYRKHPGDVIDLTTTRILRMQMKVLASSWVSVSGVSVHEDGLVQWATPQIRILTGILRYPVMAGPDIIVRYLSRDSILDGTAFGEHRDLAPIVPNALSDFGGPVHPYAFTAPVFVDKEGDGQLRFSNPLTLPPPDKPEEEDAPPP